MHSRKCFSNLKNKKRIFSIFLGLTYTAFETFLSRVFLPADVRLFIADLETGSTLEVSDFLKTAQEEAGKCRLGIIVIFFSPFFEQTRRNCFNISSQKDNIKKKCRAFRSRISILSNVHNHIYVTDAT
jgi:hypothetical protein